MDRATVQQWESAGPWCAGLWDQMMEPLVPMSLAAFLSARSVRPHPHVRAARDTAGGKHGRSIGTEKCTQHALKPIAMRLENLKWSNFTPTWIAQNGFRIN